MIVFGSSQSIENIASTDYCGCCIGVTININHGILFVVGRMLGLRTVCWWTGTDVLKYNNVWHYRWRMKLWQLFVDENWVVATWLGDELSFETKDVEIKPRWIRENSVLQA